MSAQLTEKEFSKHVNTKFRVKANQPVEIELTQVKGYPGRPEEQAGMERFSAYFQGPPDRFLEQKVYSIEHEGMGEFDLFLVPVGQDANGFRYEAVFNYYKTD
jgi:hypothetical protein